MKNLTADNRQDTRSMVQTAIFGAIIIIMAFTPFLQIFRWALPGQRLFTYRLFWRRCF